MTIRVVFWSNEESKNKFLTIDYEHMYTVLKIIDEFEE